MDKEVADLVAELRRTRRQAVSYREVVTKDGGLATRDAEVDVPVHGEIALRAADMIERLATPPNEPGR